MMGWPLVFTEQYEKRALRFLKCHPELSSIWEQYLGTQY